MDYVYIDVGDRTIVGQIWSGNLVRHKVVEPDTALPGSIYRGRVEEVLSWMDGFKVLIGEQLYGFLPRRDSEGDLKVGEQVLVQLKHPPTTDKISRVTMKYTLRGDYLVLDPFSEGIRISSKILDDDTRAALTALGKELEYEGGIVFRTSASIAADSDVKREYEVLKLKLELIAAEINFLPTPKTVYLESFDPVAFLGDCLQPYCKIITNSKSVLNTLVKSGYKEITEYDSIYESKFDRTVQFGVGSMVKRRVELASGINLLFEELETLTVVDVNSGSFKGTGSKCGSAYEVNSTAVDVILRQLKLREIGGIVLIDFIRMNEKDSKSVASMVKTSFYDLGLKGRLYGFTGSGLFELIINR